MNDDLKRERDEMMIAPADASDDVLIRRLTRYYQQPEHETHCRVCGDQLQGRIDGATMILECPALMDDPEEEGHLIPKPGRIYIPHYLNRTAADEAEEEHRTKSRVFVQPIGDRNVMELVRRYRRATREEVA